MMKSLKTNYLGKNYLEQCNKITIKEILNKVKIKVEEEVLNMELSWIEIIHSKANFWWYRSWFKCPYCKKQSFTLYEINWEFKCRKCSWLRYKKQRYKWMIEEKISN